MNQFKRVNHTLSFHTCHHYPFLQLTMSSTELGVDADADQDLRDVFKLMYDDEDDWEIDEVCLDLRRITTADSRMIIHP